MRKTIFIVILNIIITISTVNIMRLGGLSYLQNKVTGTPAKQVATINYHNYNYDTLESIFAVTPKTQNKVIFIGDSLIANCPWEEFFPGVLNRGINGDTTAGVIGRLDSIIKLKPSKVFIVIGINDLLQNVPPDVFINNYIQIIQKLSPICTVYVHSIIPYDDRVFREKPVLTNSQIINVNNEIKKLCSDNVIYIDLYSLFEINGKYNDNYTLDGLHPNGEGYVIWADLIKQYGK